MFASARLRLALAAGTCLLGSHLGACAEVEPPPAQPHVHACYERSGWMLWYGPGESSLNDFRMTTLKNGLEQWKADEATLLVIGHADSAGSPAENRVLSLKRAEVVKEYLIKAGIPEGRIIASGMGSSMLLVNAPHGTPEAQNRRVNIRVYSRVTNTCMQEVRKPFVEWFARNCKPTPGRGQAEDCKAVNEKYYIDR